MRFAKKQSLLLGCAVFGAWPKFPFVLMDYPKETPRLLELVKDVHIACEILVSVRLLLQKIPCIKSAGLTCFDEREIPRREALLL